MPKFSEQFNRFYTVLFAKGEFSIDCEKCPIKNACHSWSDKLTVSEAENAPTCEELLFSFILTGETPA